MSCSQAKQLDSALKKLDDLPEELQSRIDYGLYGGYEQFFIVGVDGSLAQLGSRLPNEKNLAAIVARADREHILLLHRRCVS